MILLLGATGYIGQAFAAYLQERSLPFQAISRSAVDYTRFKPLLAFLRETRPEFIINCAGFTGKPNVDACEDQKAETLVGNALFPLTLAQACEVATVPFGHVSSGCIYAGGWVQGESGTWSVVRDLNTPEYRELALRQPERLRGFVEGDTPNFTFHQPPCSFYSGTKALGEEALADFDNHFVWRLRIPFDGVASPRNYLTKIQTYPKVYDNLNSLSQRADYARACVECWTKKVPFGTYNVTNPGFVSTKEVVEMIRSHQQPARAFEFWESDEEFYRVGAKTPRSNCLMDSAKLAAAGIHMDDVRVALDRALARMKQSQATQAN